MVTDTPTPRELFDEWLADIEAELSRDRLTFEKVEEILGEEELEEALAYDPRSYRSPVDAAHEIRYLIDMKGDK